MKRVNVTDARPGQKVAQDVKDLKGTVLVGSGAALTEQALQRLTQKGVLWVMLQEEAEASPAPTPGETDAGPQAADEELDRIFSGTADSPLMAALLDAAKRHLNRKSG